MKFVVFEGLDGSGKSTQIKLLQKYLKSQNIPFKYLHFPRTDSPVYGEMVAMFLQGKFGDIRSVNPYLVALLYAGDRKDASEMIQTWLQEGFLVLVDRYVHSNIAFQCAKLDSLEEKNTLRNWILYLEYTYHAIPVPDLSLLLTVPFEFTKNKLTQRRKGEDRMYLNGAKDIHEADLDFQRKVREAYEWQTEIESNFKIVDCADENNLMLPKEVIHNKVIKTLQSEGIL